MAKDKWRFWAMAGAAVLIGAVVLAAGCAGATKNRNPVGEVFPTVRGESLDQKEWTLPDDLEGPAILLVGYVQNAQFDIDRWLIGLDQVGTKIPFYEVPTIDGLFPGIFANQIDEGMRKGIPNELWGGVITVYADADQIVELTGDERPNNGRVILVDRDGKIVWFHDRGFSPLHLKEMLAKADSLPRAKR